jgi:hypothetical protein
MFDRSTGQAAVVEGGTLDFKALVSTTDPSGSGEIARDILAFSNTEGGIILGGVDDSGNAIGHEHIDVRKLRQDLGPYLGTRVDYDYSEVAVTVRGRELRIAAFVVPRSRAASPALLRKTVQERGLIRKVKYLPGSLFYRAGQQTLVAPLGDAADEKAQSLGFSWAAPRTRSSFILKEDKPLLRLYETINDRVFGRDAELAEMRALFDDPRGRGVSIAGLGGIGKTELAIRLVQAVHDSRRFEHVYCGSAKETVFGAGGVQPVDPAFRDFPSFVRDLASWLGLQPGDADPEALANECVEELKRLKRVLLFVDNLETVSDRRLPLFLENRLPANSWLVVTGRVHKVRSFVAAKELQPLSKRDAALLLRHEFKRQGLGDLADLPIDELGKQAERLHLHPLALRWFAWACKIRPRTWDERFDVPLKDIESFCVAHTLNNLPEAASRALCALIAMRGIVEGVDQHIAEIIRESGAELEAALYELECSGLVAVAIHEDGRASYSPSPLSEGPARELTRRKGWERDFTERIRGLTRDGAGIAAIPEVIRDLLALSLWQVKGFSTDERRSLIERVQRSMAKCPDSLHPKLIALHAEAERHQGNLITADDLYRRAAEGCLPIADPRITTDRPSILLEAATVALVRGRTLPQATRALRYLEHVPSEGGWASRVLGMLTEAYAITGNVAKYQEYRRRADEYLDVHRGEMATTQLTQMEMALERANERMSKPSV